MGPAGGNRKTLSPRVQNRFNIINSGTPRDSSLQRIFRSILNQKFQGIEFVILIVKSFRLR